MKLRTLVLILGLVSLSLGAHGKSHKMRAHAMDGEEVVAAAAATEEAAASGAVNDKAAEILENAADKNLEEATAQINATLSEETAAPAAEEAAVVDAAAATTTAAPATDAAATDATVAAVVEEVAATEEVAAADATEEIAAAVTEEVAAVADTEESVAAVIEEVASAAATEEAAATDALPDAETVLAGTAPEEETVVAAVTEEAAPAAGGENGPVLEKLYDAFKNQAVTASAAGEEVGADVVDPDNLQKIIDLFNGILAGSVDSGKALKEEEFQGKFVSSLQGIISNYKISLADFKADLARSATRYANFKKVGVSLDTFEQSLQMFEKTMREKRKQDHLALLQKLKNVFKLLLEYITKNHKTIINLSSRLQKNLIDKRILSNMVNALKGIADGVTPYLWNPQLAEGLKSDLQSVVTTIQTKDTPKENILESVKTFQDSVVNTVEQDAASAPQSGNLQGFLNNLAEQVKEDGGAAAAAEEAAPVDAITEEAAPVDAITEEVVAAIGDTAPVEETAVADAAATTDAGTADVAAAVEAATTPDVGTEEAVVTADAAADVAPTEEVSLAGDEAVKAAEETVAVAEAVNAAAAGEETVAAAAPAEELVAAPVEETADENVGAGTLVMRFKRTASKTLYQTLFEDVENNINGLTNSDSKLRKDNNEVKKLTHSLHQDYARFKSTKSKVYLKKMNALVSKLEKKQKSQKQAAALKNLKSGLNLMNIYGNF